jgi:GDP-D-mannose dehydratase
MCVCFQGVTTVHLWSCNRSGYVGTEVTKQLLEKGYTVRATVRSTSNKDKVAHLLALGEALPGENALAAYWLRWSTSY